jgi:uncharacterized protein (UPF0332 family)
LPPSPKSLLEQAEALAADPRQEYLRRAISTAYYGLFHFTLTAAADLVVGAANQATPRYALVYRSVDHGRLRGLCSNIKQSNPQGLPFIPADGFGTVADFARNALNLHELRNFADYDPSRNFTADEARVAVSDARQAIEWFKLGTPEQQDAFLTLLLFKPR